MQMSSQTERDTDTLELYPQSFVKCWHQSNISFNAATRVASSLNQIICCGHTIQVLKTL